MDMQTIRRVGALHARVPTASVLPRWPAVLLVAAAVSPPLVAWLLPHPLDRMLAVPMGVALVDRHGYCD